MSVPAGDLIPVELYGGPLDGMRMPMPALPAGADVALVRCRETGKVYSYEWANRTVRKGKLWVLSFDQEVGTQGGCQ